MPPFVIVEVFGLVTATSLKNDGLDALLRQLIAERATACA
jgi:hypothetical protein